MNTIDRSRGYDADVSIIGGGIVGVSTAMQLTRRYPGISGLLLEKEPTLAAHQSGHNSGMIHAGVYYAPGNLRAEFCRRGAAATYEFARRHGVPVEQCGKLIVATNDIEVERLNALYTRCRQNHLDPQLLDEAALRKIEPRIVGRAAIRVAASGIADYPSMTAAMARLAQNGGTQILLDRRVEALHEDANGVTAETPHGSYRARFAIACTGLMADRLASMCNIELDFRIVPFRGEYFRLPASKNDIVKHLIYPVPDPELPFLGVHLTRMIGGYVTVGPNAVLALAREGYRWRDVNLGDLASIASFGGFWKMLRKHRVSGLAEARNSIWRKGYLELCQKYCPELELCDLNPHPAGVRAQAIMSDGTMVHDFLIRSSRRSLHVCNAPSPAATSALPIGAYLVEQFEKHFAASPSLVFSGKPGVSAIDPSEAPSHPA
ncbi:L-2-hydroxyglutarate oxidase [Paraburkholderia silviterrae]|uniref:L-2-hydroxyglutarate oxidase n=1 Tax=Paraburkholderia silviterrae TaxID=2528715 RepID=A0A4R5M6I6_9BURK|nr:L-2-hydroxyglutarate oxidase [Paraburkholderia silviterrae]TDG21738.1 L-2-hydroxyglutarate oxidase [Paraburkholderia silviterrae]